MDAQPEPKTKIVERVRALEYIVDTDGRDAEVKWSGSIDHALVFCERLKEGLLLEKRRQEVAEGAAQAIRAFFDSDEGKTLIMHSIARALASAPTTAPNGAAPRPKKK